ncbi:hypothetical protein [Acinetobacter modestus]|uniref:hypothetical protein n=1 Tax=Acinetobacter modestus TaxID=1776740 RepID=UPI003018C6A5
MQSDSTAQTEQAETLLKIEKFKAFCIANLGMSPNEEAFQSYQIGVDPVFKTIEMNRLFSTWIILELTKKRLNYSLSKFDYTREKLDKLENENKFSLLEGYHAGTEPYTNWVVFCDCCTQIVKNIKTTLGAECPEELKKYQELSQ